MIQNSSLDMRFSKHKGALAIDLWLVPPLGGKSGESPLKRLEHGYGDFWPDL